MQVATITQPRLRPERPPRSDAVVLLQLFAVTLMVIPSDMVLRPIGAAGYPAALIGIFIFAVYTASVLFGVHKPVAHPIRGVLLVIWFAVLASYIAMDRGHLTGIELRSADRMLIRFAVFTGVALVAAECLRSLDDVMRVLRALCWGGAICGFIAVLQYWMGIDLAQYLRQLPGFVPNHDNPAILARGSLNRVAGTAIHPIELGVVSGMMIPLAACVGLYDRGKRTSKRWTPLALIVLGVAASVSRSAIVSVLVAFATLVVFLPPRVRLAALSALPVALAAIFMSAHGLIGILVSFFVGAREDPSIMYRTHDYPLAEQLWQSSPFFGRGPGTWIPADLLDIFDNQWLGTVVETGTVGVLAYLVLFLAPPIAAIVARGWSANADLRIVLGSLAAAAMPAALTSATFDSFSFPMFVNVLALVAGMTGACWRLAAAERELGAATIPSATLRPVRTHRSLSPGHWPGRAGT